MDAISEFVESSVAALVPLFGWVPPLPEPDVGYKLPVREDFAFITFCFLVILVLDKTLEYAGYFSDFKNVANNRKLRETR